jgi:hypothetical protein
MKINLIKHPGGFAAADDNEADRIKKFKNGEMYEGEFKLVRNPAFHRKMFAFFNFCFHHWSADKTDWQYFDEPKQRETFRKNLTVLAGFKDVTYTIDGRARVEAKSLAYGNMDQEEFEQCYNAIIQAAITNVFQGADQNTINQLYSFF